MNRDQANFKDFDLAMEAFEKKIQEFKSKQFFTKDDLKEEKAKKKTNGILGKRQRDESPQQVADMQD